MCADVKEREIQDVYATQKFLNLFTFEKNAEIICEREASASAILSQVCFHYYYSLLLSIISL